MSGISNTHNKTNCTKILSQLTKQKCLCHTTTHTARVRNKNTKTNLNNNIHQPKSSDVPLMKTPLQHVWYILPTPMDTKTQLCIFPVSHLQEVLCLIGTDNWTVLNLCLPSFVPINRCVYLESIQLISNLIEIKKQRNPTEHCSIYQF